MKTNMKYGADVFNQLCSLYKLWQERKIFLALDQTLAIFVASTIILSGYCTLLEIRHLYAFIASAVISIFLQKNLRHSLAFLSIISLSYILSASFYDYSVDGRIHLQETIIQINNKWNYFTQSFPIDKTWWGWQWANYYPVGMQLYAASVYDIFDNIQAGKSIYPILVSQNIILLFKIFEDFKLDKLNRIFLSILIVSNPIVMSQFFTFYVDGLIYLCFIFSLSSLYVFITKNSLSYKFLFFIYAILIPSIKISGCLGFFILVCISTVANIKGHDIFSIKYIFVILILMVPTYYTPYIKHFPELFDIIQRGANNLPYNIQNMNILLKYIYVIFGVSIPAHVPLSLTFFPVNTDLLFDYSFGLYSSFWGFSLIGTIPYYVFNIKNKIFYIPLLIFFIPICYDLCLNQRYYPYMYLIPFFIVFSTDRIRRFYLALLYILYPIYIHHLVFLVGQSYSFTEQINKVVCSIDNVDKQITFIGLPNRNEHLNDFFLVNAYSDRLFFNKSYIYLYHHTYNLDEEELKEIDRFDVEENKTLFFLSKNDEYIQNLNYGKFFLVKTEDLEKKFTVKTRSSEFQRVSGKKYVMKLTQAGFRKIYLTGASDIFILPPDTISVEITAKNSIGMVKIYEGDMKNLFPSSARALIHK